MSPPPSCELHWADAIAKKPRVHAKRNQAELRRHLAATDADLRACFERFGVPGMVQVQLTIESSGRVSSAAAVGTFASTPTGDCAVRAVKNMRLPPFAGPPLEITYPIVLRNQ